jgi:hypothetical protein
VRPGVYERSEPTLVMVGRWGLTITVTPRRGSAASVVLLDQAAG